MLDENKVRELNIYATRIRIETMKEFKARGFGHLGGSMSIIDTLAVLYGEVMNINPEDPQWKDRDWLVVSKGHSGPAVYAALALRGYFPIEELLTLNQPGTNFPSHCDRNKTPGIDMTTGSLGQGMSTAIGVALGNRLDGRKSKTYLIIGDGECDEGQIWEGILFAAQKKLDNLIVFVDCNKQQLDGYTKDIMDVGNLAEKFTCFGWYAQEIDGSDVAEIYDAIEKAKEHEGGPGIIVLNTIKGKGCCFAEGKVDNHHINISVKQADEALEELSKLLAEQITKKDMGR